MYDIEKDIENVAKAIELTINNGKVTGLIENSSITFVLPFNEIARAALNASTAVKQLKELREDIEDMAYRFSCVIDHATGGVLSKTNYVEQVYYTAIDEANQRLFEDLIKDAIKPLKEELKEAEERIRELEKEDVIEWDIPDENGCRAYLDDENTTADCRCHCQNCV